MDDIFKKAAKNLSDMSKISSMDVIKNNPSEDLISKTADFSQDDYSDIENINVKNFDDFVTAMENEHAVKFHRILKALPPAQFMDKYLKALEFVKPKIIRSTASKGKKKDGRVEVIINKNPKKAI